MHIVIWVIVLLLLFAMGLVGYIVGYQNGIRDIIDELNFKISESDGGIV